MLMANRGGFTLIEVTLVLAIVGALFVIVFAGQSNLRAQYQFSSSIEKVVTNINSVHNSALTTVNATGTGTGNKQVIGQDILFSIITPKKMKISTMFYTPPPTSTIDDTTVASTNLTLPNGIKYVNGNTTKIYFVRTVQTGELLTFIATQANGFQSGETNPANYYKYSSANSPTQSTGMYLFTDSTGTKNACIKVDPSTGVATANLNPTSAEVASCHI